ncbi:hypothetical protein EJ07DRAFT_136610 [Lizonia empirigonia]|nr:hypothetical protein EJ07DRAFT_136610 [Lizonia empirigonia]
MSQVKQITPEPQALNPLPTGTRVLLRPGPEAVAYHIPIAPSTEAMSPLKTTISLPRYSAWTSGLHFHVAHTEYIRLVKGAIFIELNGSTRCVSAMANGEIDVSTSQLISDGLVVKVPRYARHNWGRLEHYINLGKRNERAERIRPEDWAEDVVVEEWTDPSGIGKPLFFWNLNGIITLPDDSFLSSRQRYAKDVLGDWWIDLQLFVVFWELDNWPVFVNMRSMWPSGVVFGNVLQISDGFEVVTSLVVLSLARVVAMLLGLRSVEQRRTPDALWDEYCQPSRNI